jgi:hypothetical protein
MRRQDEGNGSGNSGQEEPRETERGEHREKGAPELDPKPENDKGELTEEAIEEGDEAVEHAEPKDGTP